MSGYSLSVDQVRVVVIRDGDGDLVRTLRDLRQAGFRDVTVCSDAIDRGGRTGLSWPETCEIDHEGWVSCRVNNASSALAAARDSVASLGDGWLLVLRAGDSVEPGLEITLPSKVPAETVLLRARRIVDGRVSSTHPLDSRIRFGSRLTDAVRDPYLVARRLSGVLMRIPDGGLPHWSELDDDGASLLVRHLSRSNNRIYIHAEAGVIERPRREDSPQLSSFEEYRQILENDIPSWREAAEQCAPWLAQMSLLRINDVLEADRWLRFPSAMLNEEERAGVAAMLRDRLAELGESDVASYCATPMALNRRAALLAAVHGAMPNPILPSERAFWSERKVSHFFVGDPPSERWMVDGVRHEPSETKIVTHRYFDEVFVHERIVWLPKGEIRGWLDGREVTVSPYRGDQRPRAPRPGVATLLKRKVGIEVNTLQRRLRQRLSRERPRRHGDDVELCRLADQCGPTRVWLYMDRHDAAGDNAEPLYRYARRRYPWIRHVFALERGSTDWARLADEGFELVDPTGGEFDIVWSQAENLLLSDVGDPLIAGRLQGAGTRHDQCVIFLQHGVTMRHMWRWFNTRRIDVLVTATIPETDEIVCDGSPYVLTRREVWRTGFPRHDVAFGLLGQDRDRIVLAPTWRSDVARALGRDPSRTDLLDELYGPWLDLARRLSAAGQHPILFAHPKLSLLVPEWFETLDVDTMTGRDVPVELARASVVISDQSSILDEGILLGAHPIVWRPHRMPDADRYCRMHEALGVPVVEGCENIFGTVLQAAREQQPDPGVISDAGACERILNRLVEVN